MTTTGVLTATLAARLVDARPVTRWIVRLPPVFWFYSSIPVGDIATRSERVIPIF